MQGNRQGGYSGYNLMQHSQDDVILPFSKYKF